MTAHSEHGGEVARDPAMIGSSLAINQPARAAGVRDMVNNLAHLYDARTQPLMQIACVTGALIDAPVTEIGRYAELAVGVFTVRLRADGSPCPLVCRLGGAVSQAGGTATFQAVYVPHRSRESGREYLSVLSDAEPGENAFETTTTGTAPAWDPTAYVIEMRAPVTRFARRQRIASGAAGEPARNVWTIEGALYITAKTTDLASVPQLAGFTAREWIGDDS